jgi:glycosyltransferase involved in cell wall biosynthesis
MGWNSRCYVQATIAALRERIPVLVRGDSHLGTRRSTWKRKTKDLIYPIWIRRFAACLAVGQRSAEYFRYYGAKKIVLSPHFVDNDWFADRAFSAAAEREELRHRWGCSVKSFLFLFAGKLEEKKRPLDAIRALCLCRAKGMDAELLIAGDGTLKESCEGYAKQENLPVHFIGFSNQSLMPKVYAAADALILPSDNRETWGLVVNEAMACGLPVIVSDEVGCVPDLVQQGCGSIFSCGNTEALADVMIKMASSIEASRMIGEQARKKIATFSVDRAESGVIEALSLVGLG